MRYDKVEFNSKSRRLLPPLTREPPKLASSLRGTPQRSPSLSEGGFYGGIYILTDTTKVCVDLSVCKPYDFQIITFKDFSTAFVLQGLRAMSIPLKLSVPQGSLWEGDSAVGD